MRNNSHTKHIEGFTLIEMAIVLVVISLLVGGVMAGQAMIAAANMRAQITDLQKYKTAVKLFDELYKGIPGDITNATTLFGATTTNGNGNGSLEAATINFPYAQTLVTPDNGNYDGERPQFFKQLYLSKLINQPFDGSINLGLGYPKVKLNPTAGAFVGGAWNYGGSGNNQYSDISLIATANLYFATFNNTNLFGTNTAAHNDYGGTFTSGEMWEMEKKIDDSVPASGKILAQALIMNATDPQCETATNYVLSSGNNKVCNMLYDLTD